jgi:hypothetical protein
MQWERVSLLPDLNLSKAKTIIDKPTLCVKHSFCIESPFAHLQAVIADRASAGDDDAIMEIVKLNRSHRITTRKALDIFCEKFDVLRWTGEVDVEEMPPAPLISPVASLETLRIIARKIRTERKSWRQ